MKNEKKYINLSYSIRDERGFLIDKKKRFSTFLEAVKFVRDNKLNPEENKRVVGKPTLY